MSTGTFPITGILGSNPDQPLPTRQEITAWAADVNNAYQASLFMRAMAAFKAMDVTKKLSFFQIAAIHCYPAVDWDGVKNAGGFCVHGEVTFPTWHRTYMLLFEQVVYQNMEKIIDGWVQTKELSKADEPIWRAAALQFRLPYWDWARPQPSGQFVLPAVFTTERVNIKTPSNGTESFENPLVKFSNPSGKAMGDDSMGPNKIPDDPEGLGGALPWSKCVGTSRYGILQTPTKSGIQPASGWVGLDGVNNWENVNSAIQDPVRRQPKAPGRDTSSLSEMVGRILAPGIFQSWEAFASTIYMSESRTPAPAAAEYLSLEYVHNLMHNTTGGLYMSEAAREADAGRIGFRGLGLGHMSDVPVAAFDPIFYFHHCNIDRLMAIWQQFNDQLWFNAPASDDPLPSAPLPPFHTNTSGGQWTSDATRDHRALHYDYDDVAPAPGLNITNPADRETYLADLRAYIDDLYPHTAHLVQDVAGYVQNGKFDDYIINIAYDRGAIGGRAYSIQFYLEEEAATPDAEPEVTFLGEVYTFSAPTAGCGNCTKQKARGALARAQIPLTIPLLKKLGRDAGNGPDILAGEGGPVQPSYLGADGGIDRTKIGPILNAQLRWRFVELGGRVRPATDFPDTVVRVLQGTGVVPDHGMLGDGEEGGAAPGPMYSDYSGLDEATQDKVLGFGHDGTKPGLIPED